VRGEAQPSEPPSGTVAALKARAFPRWFPAPLVLVAEDNPVNQVVALRILERGGFHAEVAANGIEALAMLSARRYDAILMDCQMPQMDGYETTVILRRRENGTRRTPIIALTAHAMKGDRERCLDAGMDDYLSKPIRRDVLIETLRRWLPPENIAAQGERFRSQAG
jgi:CheY-like chemotaxis protein